MALDSGAAVTGNQDRNAPDSSEHRLSFDRSSINRTVKIEQASEEMAFSVDRFRPMD
ncbi:hypothetical protein MKK67_31820 [Methylobacterium sp. J-072]|uniref:hypothetical protein n=1 Tax=Methylobacterium sp. J-072 TaxID=2836651 RepID=UPI001FBBF1CC|nr:hypothetical protein [Methylobacterium sp. J-072]MCJ2097070.1 hypothetical protein [Methylobacterium sp. J-072]